MRGMAGKYEMRLGIDGSEMHLPMGVQVRGAYASSFINDKRHIYVYEPGGARGGRVGVSAVAPERCSRPVKQRSGRAHDGCSARHGPASVARLATMFVPRRSLSRDSKSNAELGRWLHPP
jgi:hypothetical protein